MPTVQCSISNIYTAAHMLQYTNMLYVSDCEQLNEFTLSYKVQTIITEMLVILGCCDPCLLYIKMIISIVQHKKV